ncbi:MAG: hypothetical protein H7257_06435 [Taibaiella sp.]|nr:hypothetical protein [Taibaiella sp.]
MKKISFIALLLISFCYNASAQDITGRRHYRFAAHVTSPLGLASKIGGELESRTGNFSNLFMYTKYYGAFAGKQYGYEMQKHFNSKSPHQFYIYLKLAAGEATFDNKKLSMIGHTQDIVVGPMGYAGAALGVGRRYNYGVLFFRWNLGLKYYAIADAPSKDDIYATAQHNMFRLFYFTGPGSIVEANLHFGLQL